MTTTTTTTDRTGQLDGERVDLLAGLAKARYFLRFTARDLDDEQAGRRTTVSALTIGGLIKHVTATERNWARFAVVGPSAMASNDKDFADWTAEDYAEYENSFTMLPGETLVALLEQYEDVAARTDELVRTIAGCDPAAAQGSLVHRGVLVRAPGVPAHHRRDDPTRRARRHHPGVPGRRQEHGLTRWRKGVVDPRATTRTPQIAVSAPPGGQ